MTVSSRTVGGLEILAPVGPAHEAILTAEALEFVGSLARDFAPTRDVLLARRRERQRRFDAGERPDFLPETREVREADWTVAPLPSDLLDRRVEITGPVDRKMIINALNSGARVFMADFEDSNAPTWDTVVLGHQHLRDAVAGTITYTAPDTGKRYALGPRPAGTGRPSTRTCFSTRCQPRGRTNSVATFGPSRYCFPVSGAVNSIVPRTASAR